ncbi:hypothetical protein BT67DRAFT_24460 [Trichocladium antarcticum]|uniref:Uncharacterized protein n=1 Tax=Trichocladium antarcticum TaxID=1450529 RepID=A0AAN6ZII6_9PEZI|nr:hypothetical protein BT67DRAFT_24460 [Trichocladium antarcticum]
MPDTDIHFIDGGGARTAEKSGALASHSTGPSHSFRGSWFWQRFLTDRQTDRLAERWAEALQKIHSVTTTWCTVTCNIGQHTNPLQVTLGWRAQRANEARQVKRKRCWLGGRQPDDGHSVPGPRCWLDPWAADPARLCVHISWSVLFPSSRCRPTATEKHRYQIQASTYLKRPAALHKTTAPAHPQLPRP